jgi:hypothetical protein
VLQKEGEGRSEYRPRMQRTCHADGFLIEQDYVCPDFLHLCPPNIEQEKRQLIYLVPLQSIYVPFGAIWAQQTLDGPAATTMKRAAQAFVDESDGSNDSKNLWPKPAKAEASIRVNLTPKKGQQVVKA